MLALLLTLYFLGGVITYCQSKMVGQDPEDLAVKIAIVLWPLYAMWALWYLLNDNSGQNRP